MVVVLRQLIKRSSGLFAVPLQGIKSLWARRWFRRTLASACAVVTICWLAAALLLQFWFFPRLDTYRQPLADAVGRALGLPVEIGQMSGGWTHFRPRVDLQNVVLLSQDKPVLTLSEVHAEIAWLPLMTGSLGFHALDIKTPKLDLSRDIEGRFYLSGLPLGGDGDFRVDTLLEQGKMSLQSDQVIWVDGLRKAPPLSLRAVHLDLRSRGAKHRLDVSLTPPEALGAPLKLRVDWIGREFSAWHDWLTKINVVTQRIALTGWAPWVDYPVGVQSGQSAMDLTLSTTGTHLTQVDGTLTVTDLDTQLAPMLKPLRLKQVRTAVVYSRDVEGVKTQLKLTGLSLTDSNGKAMPAADYFVKQEISGQDETSTRTLTFGATRLDLVPLRQMAAVIPMPEAARQKIESAAPSGGLGKLQARLVLAGDVLTDYALETALTDFSMRSEDGKSFVKGLTAQIDMTAQAGRLSLNSGHSVLAMPGVLPVDEVVLDQLSGGVSWQKSADQLTIKFNDVELRNSDVQAGVKGQWSGSISPAASQIAKAGMIDAKITLDAVKTDNAWKYVPLKPTTEVGKWVKSAISGGSVSGFRIEMQGSVWDMPFGLPEAGSDPESSVAAGVPGKFFLGFKAKNIRVKYQEGYPPLENLNALFEMNQNQIKIVANQGQINGVKFSEIQARIPDVSAHEPKLLITGKGEGATAGALNFLQDSPIAAHIYHFADDLSAEGNGQLDIELKLNLVQTNDVVLNGRYTFVNNRIVVLPNLPPVNNVNGAINFTESTVESRDLQGVWSGEPLQIRIARDDKGTNIAATGRMAVSELRRFYDLPLFDQVSGKTDWQAKVLVQGGAVDLTLTSDLKGIAASLPDPFNKSASVAIPFMLSRQNLGTNSRGNGERVNQVWRMTLGNVATATLGANARGQIVRGKVLIGSGQPQGLTDQSGLQLESLKPVDLDFWVKSLGVSSLGQQGAKTVAMRTPRAPVNLTLKAPLVKVFGRRFQDLKANVQKADDHTAVQVTSRELQGDLTWSPPGGADGGERGLLQGKLSRLDLTAATEQQPGEGAAASQPIDTLPDLSFKVDELFWQGKPWGKLNFRAQNQKVEKGSSWRIDPFQLEGADLKFSGRLNWVTPNTASATQDNQTSMDFKLNSLQVGNLLAKLGFPDTVKRGTATMEGQVSWPGSPFGFKPANLSGNFKMAAKNGQFAKMDPGVGRLLGLLSLQSLPQRFSLDFRDIFSEGLAFETIEGRFDIRNGIMKTSDLKMDTPSAAVLMRGETKLAQQTQDVLVTVRPALSNSVALGVTVLNPIVGAATFVAQKVLGDPLGKVFSFQYHITGTWDDPLVDKEALPNDAAHTAKAGGEAPAKAGSRADSVAP